MFFFVLGWVGLLCLFYWMLCMFTLLSVHSLLWVGLGSFGCVCGLVAYAWHFCIFN